MEVTSIKLESGRTIHQVHNEGRIFGFLEVTCDGKALVWEQTWHDRYAPTQVVYPGPISALRAIARGEV